MRGVFRDTKGKCFMREPSELPNCQYPKLVRDYMPALIQREGGTPIYRRLKAQDKAAALKVKLNEEVEELYSALALDDKAAITEEIADLLEVLTALAYANGIYMSSVELQRQEKAAIKGTFSEGVWMESVERS